MADLDDFQQLRRLYLSDQYRYQEARYKERQDVTDVFWRSKFAFAMYGVGNMDFDDRELKLLKGMLVETKMDQYSKAVKDAVQEVVHLLQNEGVMDIKDAAVIDPFAGSGNLLFHVAQVKLPSDRHPRADGYEIDRRVHAVTANNYELLVDSRINMHLQNSLVAEPLAIPEDHLVIVLVDPPWRDAWCRDDDPTSSDMSLDHTDPPVIDIISTFKTKYPRHVESHRLMFVIPFPQKTTEESVARIVTEHHLHPLTFRERILRGCDFGQEILIGLATSPAHDSAV
eukprot:TRINITY_DN11080_c0_g1_i1.p1 TRINITY_DN11080_c0_g1~~TRINITY_DN11080_c0_g1_i1.p1  ORF type:complete len:284 (+),score=54.53 TRINITY_DN11080_c0_g1_i1:73-924(+)